MLASDFNTLDDKEVTARSALHSIADRPTRGANILDRVYVNTPCYSTVIDSTVKSDHRAVVAYQDHVHVQPLNKHRHRRPYRRRTPAQHAQFLEYASTLKIKLDENADAQTNFHTMYGVMLELLDTFYPEHEITVTSSDPPYDTPTVKTLLRRKNH